MTAIDEAISMARARRVDVSAPMLVAGLAGVIACSVALFAPAVLNDGDSYWHVAAGELMLRYGDILRTDPFSFTFAGKPWHTHEWLAEVLMAVAYRVNGWSGVVVLYGAAVGLTIGTLGARLLKRLTPLTTAVALGLAFGCLAPSLLARPHVLGWPILAIWTIGLLEARDARRAPEPWRALLIAVWANLHASYLFGLALIAPFALEAVIEAREDRSAQARAWGAFAALSGAAALVTPFGLSGVTFPLQLMQMKSLGGLIEWSPADFTHFGPFEGMLLATLFVLISRGARVPVLRLIILMGLLHMALQHRRHEMLLAIVGPLLLARPLGQAIGAAPSPQSAPAAVRSVIASVALATLVVAARMVAPITIGDGPSSPVTAVQHVPSDMAKRPVFNDYGFGGYLISAGLAPFIDGRTDMYGDGFVNHYFRAGRPDLDAFDEILSRWDIDWTLLRPGDPLVGVLDRKPGWRRLYSDVFAVVHVREAGLAAASPPEGGRATPKRPPLAPQPKPATS